MNRNLILVRGVSGSGKSTFAELLGGTVYSADQYFEDVHGNYNFDSTKLPAAHALCQTNTEKAMEHGLSKIIVTNTFTTEWEMKPYFEMAKRHGYKVFSIIVENRHGGTNVHDVPDIVLQKQKSRFNIKL